VEEQTEPALSLLGSAYDHIDLTAAALGADQPLTPIGHRRFGAVPLGHLGRVGLDLMPTILAPNDQPDAGGGSIAERHRRAGLCLHNYFSVAFCAFVSHYLAKKKQSSRSTSRSATALILGCKPLENAAT
jgi:hypothetical protein